MTYREPKVAEYWLILSDLHVGSEVAPMPPKVEQTLLNGDKRTITPNPAQAAINKVWHEMEKNLPPLTGIIINGDGCDGNNRKSIGRGAWTTDLRTQVRACAELLQPVVAKLKHPGNLYMTQGSEYHVVDDRPLDQAVCDALGGQYQAEHVIPMLHGDFRVQVHHYLSGGLGNWQYLPTAPARDQMLMAVNSDPMEYGDINWVIRSHKHHYTNVQFSAYSGVTVTPSWQGKTEYAVRKGLVSVPKIGYCILKLYDDGTAVMRPFLTRAIKPCREATVL
ncbi:MAG: hypothetical protein WC375_06495 [Methanomassiliicoccales archaeon]|jgi:hypothetical protein